MSLDIQALEAELKNIEAERSTAEERLRLFSQRGRGRGRGRWAPGRGAPEILQDQHERPGERAGPARGGLSAGLRERLGGLGGRSAAGDIGPPPRTGRGNHDWRGESRDRRSSGGFDRYEPTPAESASEAQQEPLPGSNKDRLASAIVVDAAQQGNEPGTSKRPLENGSANPAQKQRNKRLFGSLLGTLQKFQEEDQRFKRSRLAQQRAEAEQRAEQRAAAEAEKLRDQHRQEIARARLDEINRKRELETKLHAKRREITVAQQLEREARLGGWLKTGAQPPLLWLPKIHNEDTELLLEQRQADLEAWKEAQLTKLQAETAQIEARYKPLQPQQRPADSKAADAMHIDESAEEAIKEEQTAPEQDRYEAEEEKVELAEDGMEDLAGIDENEGVQDLL